MQKKSSVILIFYLASTDNINKFITSLVFIKFKERLGSVAAVHHQSHFYGKLAPNRVIYGRNRSTNNLFHSEPNIKMLLIPGAVSNLNYFT